MHTINTITLDWFSKKQVTVETATYGSEFLAARTCTEYIMDIRTPLRYPVVPIRKKYYVFGGNGSVVNSLHLYHHYWYIMGCFSCL